MKGLLVASTLLCGVLYASEENLFDSVLVDRNRMVIEINKEFKRKYLTADFFAEYDSRIDLSKLDRSIQIMPCLMNLISIVWISGKTYYVDSLDKELYASLKTVKKVFKKLYPRTAWKGKLIPRTLVTNTFTPKKDTKKRVALLFSGGVDSTASSLVHRKKRQLLVTVWGHWDLPLSNVDLWLTRKGHLKKFARSFGHESSFIRSNYFWFLNRKVLDHISKEIPSWRILTVEGIGWAGLVAPLLLLKGYPILLHGSTISWDFPYPAAANPFIDDNIRFSGVGLKHDLFDINRLEKCSLIARIVKAKKLKRPFIRVCEEKIVENCCRCQKCLRTILEFLVIGENPMHYGFAENVEKSLERVQSLAHSYTMSATTVWHLCHIQEYLRARKEEGMFINPAFEWIFSLNLANKKGSEVGHAKRINWLDFIEFLPTIHVPERYRKILS